VRCTGEWPCTPPPRTPCCDFEGQTWDPHSASTGIGVAGRDRARNGDEDSPGWSIRVSLDAHHEVLRLRAGRRTSYRVRNDARTDHGKRRETRSHRPSKRATRCASRPESGHRHEGLRHATNAESAHCRSLGQRRRVRSRPPCRAHRVRSAATLREWQRRRGHGRDAPSVDSARSKDPWRRARACSHLPCRSATREMFSVLLIRMGYRL